MAHLWTFMTKKLLDFTASPKLRNSFFYGYDASDIVHTMIDDQRHTFNHHHRGVKSQCLRFVNAYFTDESIEVHQ